MSKIILVLKHVEKVGELSIAQGAKRKSEEMKVADGKLERLAAHNLERGLHTIGRCSKIFKNARRC
jgi:hypothetical protein